MATINASNVNINLTANGATDTNGTLNWTKPTLPADATIKSITVSGTYTWSGKGSVTATINGNNLVNGQTFSIELGANATSPYTISCKGNNKNATGNSFGWGTLTITYTYSIPSNEHLYLKINGVWKECIVYKKISGQWVEQEELAPLFNTTTNYVKG